MLQCSNEKMLVFALVYVNINALCYCVAQGGRFPLRAQRVVIRKYGNRRLYDTSASRYINLEGLAALVRKGTDVRVVDAKTGDDLTRVTLTQIIAEDAKEQPAGLPLELLRQLIVTSNQVGHDFLAWYLKSASEAYHRIQGALETGAATFSPLQMMKNLVAGPGKADELQELRRRIAELEARQKPRKKPRRKR